MRGRTVFRLSASVIVVASWLAIGFAGGNALDTPGRGTVGNVGDVFELLAWFLAAGALACLAGWWRDPVAALLVCLAGIVGAAAVAWAAGVPDVLPGEPSAMRSGYHSMIIAIAAGASAICGLLVVMAGYWLGRLVRYGRDRWS